MPRHINYTVDMSLINQKQTTDFDIEKGTSFRRWDYMGGIIYIEAWAQCSTCLYRTSLTVSSPLGKGMHHMTQCSPTDVNEKIS
jgi:hypothetical protein